MLKENIDLKFCVFQKNQILLSSQGVEYQNINLHLAREDGSQIPSKEIKRGLYSIKYTDFKKSPMGIGFFYFREKEGTIKKSCTFQIAPMKAVGNPAEKLIDCFQIFMQQCCKTKSKAIGSGQISFWKKKYQEICNQTKSG